MADDDDSGQDWNEIDEQDDDEIDSEGRIIRIYNNCNWINSFLVLTDDADETGDKLDASAGAAGEAEGI